VRVSVAGPAARDGGRGDQGLPFEHPFHPAEVLGGGVDLAPFPEQHDDLRARIPLEVDVRGRADVIAPAMLRRGQSLHHVRGRVAVEEGDHAERVGVGVSERTFGELLSNERAQRVRTARAVPLGDPTVEEGEEVRFERNAEAHDLDRHVSVPGLGPNPIFSYPFTR